jgi:hypothetical protein
MSCNWMIVEYTPDEHSGMLLTLSTRKSKAGTAVLEYVLYYSGRSHPGANVLQWLKQHSH